MHVEKQNNTGASYEPKNGEYKAGEMKNPSVNKIRGKTLANKRNRFIVEYADAI